MGGAFDFKGVRLLCRIGMSGSCAVYRGSLSQGILNLFLEGTPLAGPTRRV